MDEVDELLYGKKREQPKQAPSAPQSSGINVGAVADTIKALPQYAAGGALGLVKGVADYAVGTAQNVANLPFMPDSAREGMSNYMAARERAYREAAPDAQDSVRIGQVAGNAIPVLAAAQSQPAATLLGRMAQSGKIGGLTSALTPYEGDPENFWLGKGIQTGIGGAIAFAAPAIVEPLFRAGSAAVNSLASKAKGMMQTLSGKTSPAAVEKQLEIELKREGLDWSKFSDGVRQGLLDEARKALKAGSALDSQAVARLATAKGEGIDLTQGQATRNPLAWSREQNLARTEPGQPIADRLTQQNAQLVRRLSDRVPPGQSTDPYDVGTGLVGSLQATDTAIKGPIDAAYTAARDSLGRAAPMDAATFSKQANLALDDGMLGSYLPGEVRSILNGVSSGQIPFNVNTAVQMDRVLSAAQRSAGQGSPQSLAISKVRDALNSAPIENGLGEDAKRMFDAARGMAKDRFATLDATPAMKAAVEGGVAPEKFVEKYVISPSASIDDVGALMKQLGPDAKMQLQAQVMDYLKRQATSNATDETAKFSQAAFKRALERVGDRKLTAIFGEQTAKSLRNLQRVAEMVQVDPVAAGVNRSWTAPAAMDFLDQASKLPLVSALSGKPGDIYRGYLAGQALNMPLGTPGQQGMGPVSEDLLRRLAPRFGMLAAPVGPGIAAGLLNQ